MHIDWFALVVVAVVSIGTAVLFSALLSGGIRLLVGARTGTRSGAVVTAGYGLLALAGLLVLFGIYLIVPQFH